MTSNGIHNNQRKIALVNDVTGFGRCSVAVQLPIISQMRVQCCVLPTSVLSNHTGFDSYSFQDFTPYMQSHIDEWRKLGLKFDGICTGFLGSEAQIDIVEGFIREFGMDSWVVVDPVIGDYGKPYETYTKEMCDGMRRLVELADIVTPNLTEAAIVADVPYNSDASLNEVAEIARQIAELGPDKVVITGIPQEAGTIANVCYERGDEPYFIYGKRLGDDRSGTGDVFSAVISADAVVGTPFRNSVEKAQRFIEQCVSASLAMDLPLTDGVAFEEVLHRLR